MTCKFFIALTLMMSICFFSPLSHAVEANDTPKNLIELKVKPNLNVQPIKIISDEEFTINSVVYNKAKKLIDKLDIDDRLEVIVDDKNHLEIKEIKSLKKFTTKFERFLALALGFVSLLLLAIWASKGNPSEYIIGLDKRYSNSKT